MRVVSPRQKSPRERDWRSGARFVGASLVGVVVAMIIVGMSIGAVGSSPIQKSGGVMGPYTLNATSSEVTVGFPNCTVVSTQWKVVTGPSVDFVVAHPVADPFEHQTTCSSGGPPPCCVQCPSNCTNYGDVYDCYEVGLSGTCSLTSIESFYIFGASNSTEGAHGLEGISVTLSADFS
jgi:hypothetical protein